MFTPPTASRKARPALATRLHRRPNHSCSDYCKESPLQREPSFPSRLSLKAVLRFWSGFPEGLEGVTLQKSPGVFYCEVDQYRSICQQKHVSTAPDPGSVTGCLGPAEPTYPGPAEPACPGPAGPACPGPTEPACPGPAGPTPTHFHYIHRNNHILINAVLKLTLPSDPDVKPSPP